jgi:diguanylate cyclase (GGDEF)-like protein
VAGYWNVAWLVFGTYEIGTGRRVGRRLLWSVVAGAALLAVASVVPYAGVDSATAATARMTLRVGLRTLTAGAAFLVAGAGVWRMRSRHGGGMGPFLLALSLSLYGLEQLHYFGHALYQLATRTSPAYVALFSYLDVVILALVGMGMVAWLLEEEQGRLAVAAERIEYLAAHDPLTGLPHRHLFLEELRRAVDDAQGSDRRIGVLCLDLYGFKWVNESMGHRIGDLLLRKVGERLAGAVGAQGTVARLGGDEFAVLVPVVDRVHDVRAMAVRLTERLSEPFDVGERNLVVATSMGLSVYPDDATDPEELLSNAAAALAATVRRGRVVTWEPAMSRMAAEGFGLEGELNRALEAGELVLHYQPIFDLKLDRVVRVEALMRWRHPERGLLEPGEFFHAADLAGLTERMDLWALERALKRLRFLRRQGHDSLRMAVNLAPANLERQDLAGQIRRVLQRCELAPADLEIEITEAAAIQIGGSSLDVLQVLDRIGVGLSLDDFGTGYSSLTYLRRLPVDTVKIDRSFVHDLEVTEQATDIIRAIINLGKDLGLTVVGEGVETEEQWEILRELGCDQIQGFALGVPVPGDELAGVLEELSARRIGRVGRMGDGAA